MIRLTENVGNTLQNFLSITDSKEYVIHPKLHIIHFGFLDSGQPIPRVEYTPDELATWKEVYKKVFELLPGRACTTHRKALDIMRKECNMTEDNIPQMEEVSNYLKSKLSEVLFRQ